MEVSQLESTLKFQRGDIYFVRLDSSTGSEQNGTRPAVILQNDVGNTHEIIDKMVRQIFSRLRGIPKEQLITSRYAKETAERKNHLQALQAECDKAEKDLLALKAEILAVIKGESAFPKDTLAEMIAAQEKKHTELETLCEEASAELERNAELMANVSQLYEELISYADLYDSASFEAKKMIVSQLIRRVDVYRGYQIHVDFNFDLAQYLENSDELAC
jgi:site-specific DNA recombinase